MPAARRASGLPSALPVNPGNQPVNPGNQREAVRGRIARAHTAAQSRSPLASAAAPPVSGGEAVALRVSRRLT